MSVTRGWAWPSACLTRPIGEDVASVDERDPSADSVAVTLVCGASTDRLASPAWHSGPGRQGLGCGRGRVSGVQGLLLCTGSAMHRCVGRIQLYWAG